MRRGKDVSAKEQSPVVGGPQAEAPSGDVAEFLAWLSVTPQATEEEIAARLADFDSGSLGALRQLFADDAARKDIHRFTEAVMKDQAGEKMQTRELDRVLNQHFVDCRRDGKYCGILAPVGVGKSVGVVIVRTLWELCNDPNRLIKIVTATDDEATKRLMLVGRIIMHDPDFKRVWGHYVEPATSRAKAEEEFSQHKISVRRTSGSAEPSVEAYGVTANAQGSRANLLIFDDCVDARTALESPALKAMVKAKFQNQWLSRVVLHDHDVIWVTTRWTEDDLSGELMSNPRWRFLVIRVAEEMDHFDAEVVERGVIVERFRVPLIPTWNPTILREQLESMSEIAFNRAYRQRPYSSEDCLFPSFDKCVDENLDIEDVRKRAREERWLVYAGVDPAGLKRRGTALFVAGVDGTGKKYMLDARIGKWSQPQLGLEMNDIDERYHPVVFAVEDNGTQASFIDAWRDARQSYTFWQRLQPVTTTIQSKNNPEFGIRSLDVEFSNEAWVFPAAHVAQHKSKGGDHDKTCGLCLVFHELRHYPVHPDKDLTMACWFTRLVAVNEFRGDAGATAAIIDSTPQDDFFRSELDHLGQTHFLDGEDPDQEPIPDFY